MQSVQQRTRQAATIHDISAGRRTFPASWWRDTARAGVWWLYRLLDQHAWICVAIIVAFTLPVTLVWAHVTRLTSDEVYTFRIAQQPTVAGVLRLSRTLDLHPPLHFLLQRWALLLHLPRWIGSRLPSLIAEQIAMIAIMLLVARRLGNVVGMAAAAVFFFTPVLNFAWSNRPYALWLCFLALTALFWDRSRADDRPWWVIPSLALAALAMMMTYFFGLVCMLPLLLGEAVRSWRARRVDWSVAAALVLPCSAGAYYFEQVHRFANNHFTPLYLPSFGMGMDIYAEMLTMPVVVIAACCVVAFILFPEDRPSGLGGVNLKRCYLPMSTRTMIVCLFATPVLLMLLACVHPTQFFARYAACGSVGLALLLPVVIAKYVRRAAVVSLLLVVAMVIAGCVRMVTDNFDMFGLWRAEQYAHVPSTHLESIDASVPIVVGDPTDFTEMSDQASPEITRHLYYVTDRASALRYTGWTVFETEEDTIAKLGLPSHAEPLAPFLAEHSQFYLVANLNDPEQWMMRYLIAHNAHVEYRGKFYSTTWGDDLYFVSSLKP